MEHTASASTIYYTKDYKQFKFITGNRKLNDTKIKKIINDIDDGLNMLKYCPIVVTDDMRIIDGQHRFQVCKILKYHVFYVIAKDITLRDIAAINSRTERWKPIDFVNCYFENGNSEYKILKHFIDTYELPVSSALWVLSNGYSGSLSTQDAKHAFECGNYEATHEKEAKEIVEYALKFELFSGNRSGAFLKAIAVLMKLAKFDSAKLLSKYNAASDMLTPQSGHKGYLLKLEEIYNYKNSIRQPIY